MPEHPTPVFVCPCEHVPGYPAPVRARYVVTGYDGQAILCDYCETCAALAAADWNGETAKIERAP